MPDGESKPLVSIVLPMYNEEAIVESSLRAVTTHLDGLRDRFRFEILVVDDGSTDRSHELVGSFVADNPEIRLLKHKTNFRLGQALRFAFGASKGDYVVTFDADLTYDCGHIDRLLEALIDDGARIAIASPYMAGGEVRGVPARRLFLSKAANRFLGMTALDDLHTVTGLVRAYDGPFIRTLGLKAVDSDVNTEIIYKAQILRARIVEIPAVLDWTVVEGDRRAISGFNTRLYWVTAKQLVLGFLFRPFMFFLGPAAVMLGLSLLAAGHWAWAAVSVYGDPGVDTWSEAVRHAADEELLSVVVAAVTLLLAVVLGAVAVITLQAKRYFEELFHLTTTVRRLASGERAYRGAAATPPP